MKHVVIVPGFTESAVHFRRLINALETENLAVDVVQPWQRRKLHSYQGQAVFVGHSMGTYYVLQDKLKPALLVGVLHPTLTKRYYFSTMYGIAKHTMKQTNFSYYLKLRLWNVLNFFRYLPSYVWYGPPVLRFHPAVEQSEDVIIIRNQHDAISITENVHFHESGHHDDILYRPDAYVRHIQRLLSTIT